MPNQHANPGRRWGLPLLVAAVIGYCVYPPITILMTIAEDLGMMEAGAPVGIIWIGQALAFAIALILLIRAAGERRKLGKALIWAGGLMLTTLPLLVINVLIGPSVNMSAAFFMLLIFGIFYAMIGVAILCSGIYVLRRS